MMNQITSPLVILTGEIQAGKTTLCRETADLARREGWDVAGILSPAVFQGGQKTAIRVHDLRSGEERLLAERKGEDQRKLETRRWSFFDDAVRWGNQVLAQAVPCGLLIVDELGPIEFEKQQGWTAGLEAVDGGKYQAGLVVIRPHLVDTALNRWPTAAVWELADQDPEADAARRLLDQLEKQ